MKILNHSESALAAQYREQQFSIIEYTNEITIYRGIIPLRQV